MRLQKVHLRIERIRSQGSDIEATKGHVIVDVRPLNSERVLIIEASEEVDVDLSDWRLYP